MNTLVAVFSAHRKSAKRAWNEDSRARMAWLIRTAVFIGMGYWLVYRWTGMLSRWQQLGPEAFEFRLWLLAGGVSFPMLVLAALTAFQHGFSKDEPLLLITLPIPAALRFRLLVSVVFLEGTWRWLLLGTIALGTSLWSTMGWQSVAWLSLGLAAMGTATCLGVLLATVLVPLFLVSFRGVGRILGRIALLLTGFGAVTAAAAWLSAIGVLPRSLLPYVIALSLFVVVGLLMGPFAGIIGMHYTRAFQTLQTYSRSIVSFRLPGSVQVSRWLSRRRNLYGALLLKGFLNQSRNPIALVRAAVLVFSLLAFPFFARAAGALSVSGWVLVVGYTCLVLSVTLNEVMVNAVSGEGERLTLYLVTPARVEDYLKARFLTLLAPVIFCGMTHALVTSWLAGLTWPDTGLVLAVLVLGLAGSTGLLVWGGISDLDLDALVEGPAQTLLQEDAPVEPRRFMLLNVSMLFLALVSALAAWLPVFGTLTALVLLDVVILGLSYRYGRSRIHHLLKRS